MVKHRIFLLALASALLMTLMVGSVAFADGPVAGGAGPEQQKGEVCVDGYVINHRELPVDGTKTNPPLVVEAVMGENAENRAPNQVIATAPVGKDGYFKFSSLPAGYLAFRLQLPEGWEGIVPQIRIGGVADTGFTEFKKSTACYRIVFKIRRLVTIPVLKWEERLDGTVIPGEDWKITATPIKDPFAKVVTETIRGGQALLTLTPGTWQVCETVKNGWTPITPVCVTRVVEQYANGGAVNPIVFKNREPACHPQITVTKMGYGRNANGEMEALGTLAGWKYTVSRADTSMPPVTKVTMGDGRAVFDGLRPGVYKVTETVQSGWKVRGTNPVTVVLMDCEQVEVTFENEELIGELTIYGHKWFKAWEKPYKGTLVGLAGWTITAKLVGTDITTSTVTNALGEYRFTADQLKSAGMGFPGAAIEVCEESRDHWIHVTPKCVTVKFPYPVPADYTGVKVEFTNVQDPPLPGAAVGAAPVAGGTCSAYHSVVAGDTLAKIAGKYGVSMSGLVSANGIRNANVIYLGQKLCIR
jgi:LysM repeat protein